jgi:hypothetical protein
MDDTYNSGNQIKVLWLDTSALVKKYLDEPGSDFVRTVLGENRFWAFTTSYCIYELFGILKRKASDKSKEKIKISVDQYIRCIFLIKSDWKQKVIRIHDPEISDSDLIVEVKGIINDYKLDYVDAIQFILINKGILGKFAGDSRPVLVSSDGGILKAADHKNIRSWNPEKGPFPF